MRQGDRPLELHPYLGQRPDALLDLTLDMVSSLSGSPDRETLGNTHSHPYIRSPTHTHTPLETITHLLTYSHGLPVGRLLHVSRREKSIFMHSHVCSLSRCLKALFVSVTLKTGDKNKTKFVGNYLFKFRTVPSGRNIM